MFVRLLLLLILVLSAGCSSSETVPAEDTYSPVSIRDLVETPEIFIGQKVIVTAYVLGSEFNPSEDDAQFFILSLGERAVSGSRGNQLIFPDEKYKVRAAEDGYNGEIIKDCYIMADNARKLGQEVTIFGVFNPGEEFYYYEKGVDLYIEQIRIGERTVNTDFGDKSKLAHDAPGMLRKIYQGGKKIIDLAKKYRP